MSKERFDWLHSMGAEVHATPGCESNVKEVFDKTEELVRTRPDEVIALNQFELFTNPLFHYAVTGLIFTFTSVPWLPLSQVLLWLRSSRSAARRALVCLAFS